MSNNTQSVKWLGWETVQVIGQGGFGAVYEIQRDVLGDIEKAALKVISIPQNEGDIEDMYNDGYDTESIISIFQSHLKRIVAECTLMHIMRDRPNVVDCDGIRYVQHDDGIGWDILVKMERLTPLPMVLEKGFSEAMVLQIAQDICEALKACEDHGVVHGNIKPQDIFVSKDGNYKLGDIGIANAVMKSMSGPFDFDVDFYYYMAPEVFKHQLCDNRTDIYSLGLVLYVLMNDFRMPFVSLPPQREDERHAMHRRLRGEALPMPLNGSRKLKEIVLKACAFDPEDRFQSVTEMMEALKNIDTKKRFQIKFWR